MSATSIKMITLWFLIRALFFFLVIFAIWKKRWILYYSFKISGPLAIPFIGTLSFVKMANCTDLHKFLSNVIQSHQPVLKIWSGPQLYIITTRPEDVETVLTTNLDKTAFYDFMHYISKDSLLTAKTALWKVHRKMVNPSFNTKLLISFHDSFVKYSKQLRTTLDSKNEIEISQLLIIIWKSNLDTAIETLTEVDPTLIENRYQNIYALMECEYLLIQKFYKFWLCTDFILERSSLYKESQRASKVGRELAKQVLIEHEKLDPTRNMDDPLQRKRFLANLFQISDNTGKISREQIYEETIIMLIAASETTGITTSNVLMFLGMYPHIQEKVYEEIISVLGPNRKDPSLENINRLDYLERVIKETLRLAPPFPYIMRDVTEDIKADPYIYPTGSNIVIPILRLHTDPKVWPNPDHFDPDRFLPEEAAKHHRCSYIPFSFGTRNCIGLKYGMMIIKANLVYILKQSRVRAVNYKTMEDIQWDYLMVLKPKNCKVVFEKRNS